MRIGLIAPLAEALPPTTDGATEVVIDSLARALTAAGHDVLRAATADSTCPVSGHPVTSPAPPSGSRAAELIHAEKAYHALADCDVIHDHTTVGALWAATQPDLPPIIATAHDTFTIAARAVYGEVASRGILVTAVSQSQRDTAPDVPIGRIVHYGIDSSRYPLGRGLDGYALFVGRCAPGAGMLQAIDIARRAGVPLRIVTTVRGPEDLQHFERVIEPNLGPNVEFLGDIGPEQRNRELAGACALINPVSWLDPFCLVLVEAMACGTPVIAFPSGSAPEIVDNGVTGFLRTCVKDAASALRRVSSLDRRACRRAMQGKFGSRKMAEDYVELYAAVTSQGAVRTLPVAVTSGPSLTGEGMVLRLSDHERRSGGLDRSRRRPHWAGVPR